MIAYWAEIPTCFNQPPPPNGYLRHDPLFHLFGSFLSLLCYDELENDDLTKITRSKETSDQQRRVEEDANLKLLQWAVPNPKKRNAQFQGRLWASSHDGFMDRAFSFYSVPKSPSFDSIFPTNCGWWRIMNDVRDRIRLSPAFLLDFTDWSICTAYERIL